MTQEALVMNWLRNHNGLTQAEATKHLGVTRLPAIVWKLEHKHGFVIASKWESGENRFGVPVRFKRWYLP